MLLLLVATSPASALFPSLLSAPGGSPIEKIKPTTDAETSKCPFNFIDLGANRGDTIKGFLSGAPIWRGALQTLNLSRVVQPSQFCYHAFEPNPKWKKALEKAKADTASLFTSGHLELHHAAAVGHRTKSGKVTLRVDKHALSAGTSILKHKSIKAGSVAVSVPAVDFSHWMATNLPRKGGTKASHKLLGSVNILKLDVEGAEYQMLSDVLTSGLASRLHTLIVEWHGAKFEAERKIPPQVETTLAYLFQRIGVRVLVLATDARGSDYEHLTEVPMPAYMQNLR